MIASKTIATDHVSESGVWRVKKSLKLRKKIPSSKPAKTSRKISEPSHKTDRISADKNDQTDDD